MSTTTGLDWPLVGRTGDLERIAAAFDERAVRVVHIVGDAGTGKSRLAQEALTVAELDGFPVAHVTATASAATVPLSTLGPLLPPSAEQGDPAAVLDRVAAHVRDLADGSRMVVHVDDVDLLDAVSCTLLARLWQEGVVLVVATQRQGTTTPDVLVAESRRGGVQRLDLADLPRPSVATLLHHVLRGPVSAGAEHALWTASGGNPLFLRELVTGAVLGGRLSESDGVWVLDGAPRRHRRARRSRGRAARAPRHRRARARRPARAVRPARRRRAGHGVPARRARAARGRRRHHGEGRPAAPGGGARAPRLRAGRARRAAAAQGPSAAHGPARAQRVLRLATSRRRAARGRVAARRDRHRRRVAARRGGASSPAAPTTTRSSSGSRRPLCCSSPTSARARCSARRSTSRAGSPTPTRCSRRRTPLSATTPTPTTSSGSGSSTGSCCSSVSAAGRRRSTVWVAPPTRWLRCRSRPSSAPS